MNTDTTKKRKRERWNLGPDKSNPQNGSDKSEPYRERTVRAEP